MAGTGIVRISLYSLLYADDITLFGKTPDESPTALSILEAYCSWWKLTVNASKTNIMVFRQEARLSINLNTPIGKCNKFCYLGVVFSSGGSSFEIQKTLAGQALKAGFTRNKYLYGFTTPKTIPQIRTV